MSNLDYVLLDDSQLASSNIRYVKTDGETPDEQVNQVHFDAVNLTVLKLVQLAHIVKGSKALRFTKAQVKTKLQAALNNEWLDSDSVDEELLSQLS